MCVCVCEWGVGVCECVCVCVCVGCVCGVFVCGVCVVCVCVASHPQAPDLKAAQLLQGHAGVLAQQTGPVLQPTDGGDGIPRRLALQECHAVHPQGLIGRALADDGRRPVCEHWGLDESFGRRKKRKYCK